MKILETLGRSSAALLTVATLGVSKEAGASELPTAPTGPQMKLIYAVAEGANGKVADLQEAVGEAAIAAVQSDPIKFKIGNTSYIGKIEVPTSAESRTHAVIFVQNSDEAGAAFADEGLDQAANAKVSETIYKVAATKSGAVEDTGPSFSVVGQETGGAGLFQNITTELCQGMNLVSTPPIIKVNNYRLGKEAVCNATGVAADSRAIGMTYAEYQQRIAGEQLIQPNGSDVKLPVSPVSDAQFEAMVQLPG